MNNLAFFILAKVCKEVISCLIFMNITVMTWDIERERVRMSPTDYDFAHVGAPLVARTWAGGV